MEVNTSWRSILAGGQYKLEVNILAGVQCASLRSILARGQYYLEVNTSWRSILAGGKS